MDGIEPVEEFRAEYVPGNDFVQEGYGHSIQLEKGFDLSSLQKDGVDIVIKEHNYFDDEDEGVDPEQLFSGLGMACMGEDEDSSEDENLAPFEKISRKMTDITLDKSGVVRKMVVTQGTGKVVQKGQRATVHYSNYLEYSDEPFDSTRLRKRSEKFIVGKGEVLEGMDFGVSTMRRGERSRFLVASDYAYGPMGCPPRIPGNAIILMDIELLDISERPLVEDFYSLPEKEKKDAPFERILQVAKIEKEEGTKLYTLKEYKKAQEKWLKAQRALDNCNMRDEEDEKQMKEVMLKLCLNIAMCSLKIGGQAPRAIHNCNRALEIDRGNGKAFYRLGVAYLDLDEFSKAEKFLKKAQEKDTEDKSVNRQLQRLAKRKREIHMMESNMYSKMFKDLKNLGVEVKEDEDESQKCPKEIQEGLNEKLRCFKDSAPNVESLFLQVNQMSTSELHYLRKKAKELGLDERIIEKANEECLKISIPDANGDTAS